MIGRKTQALLVSGRAIKPISKADFHFDRKVMSRSFIMKKLVITAVRSKEMPLKFRPGKLSSGRLNGLSTKFSNDGSRVEATAERPSAWGNDFYSADVPFVPWSTTRVDLLSILSA